MLQVKQLPPHTSVCFVIFKTTEPDCCGLVLRKRRRRTPLGVSPSSHRLHAPFCTLWQLQNRQSGHFHYQKGTRYKVEENRQCPETDTTHCIGAWPSTGLWGRSPLLGKTWNKNPITSAWLQRKKWSFFTRLCLNTRSPVFAVAGFWFGCGH